MQFANNVDHLPSPPNCDPAISIVLPTHNGSRYLDLSIESVVRQTWEDWELIVVNDASTDSTPDIIDRWSRRDPRIHALHLRENRKLPGALNEGFSHAVGACHTWTSDDNWYHPRALKTMWEALEADREVSVAYAGLTNVNEHGIPFGVSEAGTPDELHIRNRIGACFLYRREVTQVLQGYDESLFGAEDYDFWLRAALRFRFHRIAEPLYFYRHQPASLSSTRQELIATNVELALRRWLPQVSWTSDETRMQAHVEWGVRCLRAGIWEEVYETWLQTADWLDTSKRATLRREALKRSTEIAWEAYTRRDWVAFENLRAYLVEVRDDPAIARLLAKNLYPRWVYTTKDYLRRSLGRYRSWLATPASSSWE